MSEAHEHAYKPTQSKVIRDSDGDKTTVVLLHCDCGDFNHASIPGEWTFEDITRKPGETKMQPDREFLREVGITECAMNGPGETH